MQSEQKLFKLHSEYQPTGDQPQKPTLVIAHNKTLAAQLYSEFKEFFPENAVEYFVSYYDSRFRDTIYRRGLVVMYQMLTLNEPFEGVWTAWILHDGDQNSSRESSKRNAVGIRL